MLKTNKLFALALKAFKANKIEVIRSSDSDVANKIAENLPKF